MDDNIVIGQILTSICSVFVYIQGAVVQKLGWGITVQAFRATDPVTSILFSTDPEGWKRGRFGGLIVFKNSRSWIPQRPLQLQSRQTNSTFGWRSGRYRIMKHLNNKMRNKQGKSCLRSKILWLFVFFLCWINYYIVACLCTIGWTFVVKGTQNGNHFRSSKVIIRLVELYRIFGRPMCLLHSENKVHLETKLLKQQTRSWKKNAVVFTAVPIINNQDQQNMWSLQNRHWATVAVNMTFVNKWL